MRVLTAAAALEHARLATGVGRCVRRGPPALGARAARPLRWRQRGTTTPRSRSLQGLWAASAARLTCGVPTLAPRVVDDRGGIEHAAVEEEVAARRLIDR